MNRSAIDVAVGDVKTFIEIIYYSFNNSNKTVTFLKNTLRPMLEKFSELADEVSILETERQRLAQENADAKKYMVVARDEIARLETENKNLLEMIAILEERNRGQANIILSKEKRHFTDGSYDFVHKYKDIQTGMMYAEIHNHIDDFESDSYDYALKA